MLEVRGDLIQIIAKNTHFFLGVQAMAEDLGDQDKAKQIQDQLNELEERAEALDRQRTKNISAIRYVIEPAFTGLLSSAHIPCHNSQANLYVLCYTLRSAQWFPPSLQAH